MSKVNKADKSIEEVEKEIIEEFNLFTDWTDRYAYIIDLGKSLSPLPEEHKVEKNKIKGCQSNVWMICREENNRIIYEAESDALIVNGLAALMVRILSGRLPDEIINAKLSFIDAIGMHKHLSPTRSNGLAAMIKQMKLFALVLRSGRA